MITNWTITLRISRQKRGDNHTYWKDYTLTVNPDDSVLDAVENVWAVHDRSLSYRHACHHSTCGACGMRVNGVEKLTCITPIRSVTHDNGIIKVEPLRNFPLIADLVVDVAPFFQNLETMRVPSIVTNSQGNLAYEKTPAGTENLERLVDCIECGLCVSACPIASTDIDYVGPAVLAGLQQSLTASVDGIDSSLADHQEGAWRCHSAYECSAVCPSDVEPGFRIMDLRKQLLRASFRRWFGNKEKK
ncbi:succinate dehydrogenase iron-sulfur subunit [Leptolinea sp. HRD-7]|nr:succinate dehydrogenase iron-sulfur subunit [Leptolinea sp. HRD-7]